MSTQDVTTKPTPATKLVEVRLSAMTRVEYTEIVEVPADITDAELNTLAHRRYEAVSGEDFTQDPEYFERGECYATDPEMPGEQPTIIVSREEGDLRFEPIEASVPASRTTGRYKNGKIEHYARFKEDHSIYITALVAQCGQLSEESHWDLIEEMKSVFGAAAANASTDNENAQDAAILNAETWVTANCSSGGIEEDVAMALWLRGMAEGEAFLCTAQVEQSNSQNRVDAPGVSS